MKALRLAIPLFFLATLSPRLPAAPEETFTLSRFVPADVQIYAVQRASPQRARLEEPFLQAFQELVRSGIGEDIFDLATMQMPQKQRDEARAVVDRLLRLFKAPGWEKLLEKEVAFAFKTSIPVPEAAVLFLVPPESAGERQGELRKLFAGLAEFAPELLVVGDSDRRGAKISRLEVKGTPFGLWTASREGVVTISTSSVILDRVFDLMESKDGAGSLALDPRFNAGLEEISGGEDSRAYFDLPGYLTFFKGFLDMAAGGVQNDPQASAAISIVRVVLEELARLGPITSVGKVEGNRVIAGTRMPFVQKDGPGFIEKLIESQQPIQHFERVVPRDALGFYMTSGIDPAKLYDGIAGLIRDRLPKGEKVLGSWEQIQDRIGFHLREDLLSSLEGGMGCVVLPGPSAGACKGCVVYLRLRSKEKPRQLFDDGLRKLKDFLGSRGQGLELAGVPGLEDFQEIRLAAFPRFHPVVGWPGDTLVVASSVDAVGRVAATFRGEAPGIRENPSFAALKVPDGPLSEVYYRDLRGSFEGLADLMGAVGFVASILPQDRDTRPILKLGAILTKLSVFFRKVDLMVDQGGWARYDPEKHAVISSQVTQLGTGEKKAF